VIYIYILTPQHWPRYTVRTCNSSHAVTHSALY